MRPLAFLLSLLILQPLAGQEKVEHIPVPEGYYRPEIQDNGFGEYLRNLDLKENNSVYLFNGELKSYQGAQYAVIAIDVGKRDLQQCADAVMRLKAEYHYSINAYEDIHFNFTNGDRVDFTYYARGYRPKISGNNVTWSLSAAPDSGYPSFRKYMDLIFTYAGSYSLSKELRTIEEVKEIRIGDVFIQGGFPGHAVIVVDLAIEKDTGKKVFLLAQSYMPAQDIHILKNPVNRNLNPWYSIERNQELHTPEWKFSSTDLKRFR